LKINKNIVESQNFIRFLENEKNNIIYLNYLKEPNKKNALELNEAYKKFERQLMVRAYLRKAIQYEAKRFDKKLRGIEKKNTSMDKPHEEGATLGDFLIDEKSVATYEEMWDSTLEDMFADIRLYKAIVNLTRKQRKILYLLYIQELSEKEVAKQLGVTQQAVSKVHRAALSKLKEVISS
jgi:RNA polymerase sigma factor (sigma-70 family)